MREANRRGLPQTPSEWAAERVRLWRGRRNNMTVEELTDEVKRLGGSLSRSAVTKIENGDRGISLDEALLLAAALKIPPAQLFFPMGTNERVSITARSTIHPHLAYEWLAGKEPLTTTERRAIAISEWAEAASPLRLYDELREEQNDTHKADTALRMATDIGDENEIRKARRRFFQQLEALADVLKAMHEVGITPPRMPKEWETQIKNLGLMEGD
jgi:transcriptional regulator with XRE-family HTH domain